MAPLPRGRHGFKGNPLTAFFKLLSKLKSCFRSSSKEEEGEAIRLKPDSQLVPSRPYNELPFNALPKSEKKVEWGFTDLTDTDEYKETMSNPWTYHRKRSVPSPGSPEIAVTGTGIGSPRQEQPGRRLLTITQEISLLVLAWLAALLICSVIIWIIVKIEKKLYRFVEEGLIGLEEKNGWRWALHWVGFSAVVITITAVLLTPIALIFSLKELLSGAI